MTLGGYKDGYCCETVAGKATYLLSMLQKQTVFKRDKNTSLLVESPLFV